jgi:3-dehydroquinate synthetase
MDVLTNYLFFTFMNIFESYPIPDISMLLKYLKNDKKNINNNINFMLVRKYGDVYSCDVELQTIKLSLDKVKSSINKIFLNN